MDEDPSEEELREASLLLGSGRRSDDAAEDYSGKVNEVLGSGAYQRAACVTCGLGVAAGSTEVMAIGLAIPMIEAEFGAGDWERNLVASCIFLGMLLGGLISGVLGDLYGRKTCMTFFTAVIAVFGGLTAIAGSLWQVACFRFLAGLGIGGNIPAIFSYVAETTHSRGRGQYMTFVASHWMLGSVVTAAIGWIILPHDVAIPLIGLSGWRAYFLVCIAPAVLLCALASLVLVESPCFLIRRRKFGAAAAALETIATANGEGGSPALAALVRQLNRHELDHEAGAAGGEGEGEALALGLRTTFALIRDFLRQRETRKLTIVLGTVWFCLSACWYGFMIWIPQFLQSKHDDVYLGNLVTSAGDLPGNVISFLIIERQGRKRTLLCSLAAASLSPIAFAAAPKVRNQLNLLSTPRPIPSHLPQSMMDHHNVT